MTSYRFRVWLLPNPPLEFEPESEVWRDLEVDGSQTLADFHEGIFEAFERWETHAYAFRTRDEHGIATRSYVHPQMYSGDQSWPPMDDEDIDQFIEQAVPDDVPEEAKERFRDLQKNPPEEGNAAKTTIDDLDLEQSQSLFYEFDFGDGWEHHIELQEIREGSLDGEPVVVDEQGDAPPQYPEYDE
ncbi:IS1096 element passenger TnpR family protein [Natronorubrum sulfidifaciens]|uniref:Plasmid pRiA4b Orf3-like domain-containing protein n=1 Tax=Natronorubrum sulfidifaciens JCM 14089 TaxID=1230460 RepID=L9W7A9_9EURY|nr:hypothetical protein [Natronorubrum sulfidifaciens]ELY45359.1 hypothetical protein C495_08135 [Natronorubrum sulfidifaciens JCM 14089]